MTFRPIRLRVTSFVTFGVFAAIASILVITLLPRHIASHRQTDAPFGAYAGYVWLGRVSSVQGTWRVPAILATSRPGLATTWIGAQGAGTRGAFIQVGTADLCGYSPKHTLEDRYWAFWSDRAHDYHLQPLFSVKPGDRLSATVALSRSGWTLTISDAATHKAATLNTGESHAPLNTAQWTQEDPVTFTGSRYTFPSLTAIRISRLLINSTAPKYESLYSTWMSINGAYTAPSPLHRDGFQLRPATLTSAGKYYLSLNIGKSQTVQRFGYQLELWTANTPLSALQIASSRLVTALSDEAGTLRSLSSPSVIKTSATLLARKFDAIIAQAQVPLRMSPGRLDAWRARLTRDAYEALYAEHILRRRLGLPELP